VPVGSRQVRKPWVDFQRLWNRYKGPAIVLVGEAIVLPVGGVVDLVVGPGLVASDSPTAEVSQQGGVAGAAGEQAGAAPEVDDHPLSVEHDPSDMTGHRCREGVRGVDAMALEGGTAPMTMIDRPARVDG